MNLSSGPPILGVAEIVLSVVDLPRMQEFYQNVLGFDFHSEACTEDEGDPNATGRPTIVFLTISDCGTPLGRNGHPVLLALIDYRRHSHAKPRFDGHDIRRSSLNHLAFEIKEEDFGRHLERLRQLGLETTLSEFPNMSAKAIFFTDPEGNALELIAHSSKP